MGTLRGVTAGAVAVAVFAVGLPAIGVPAVAQSDSVVVPQVFVRLVNPNNASIGITAWQPLGATLNSLGPYEIGVMLQSTTAQANRQAVEIDLQSAPGGVAPQAVNEFDPYLRQCELLAGAPDTIEPTGARLYFNGDGAYTMDVSMYTYDQYNASPGRTCTGGPTTNVTLNVTAGTQASIAGAPLAPRTMRRSHGFAGLRFTAPVGNTGYQWRCARNPVRTADGSVTGANVTSDRSDGAIISPTVQIPEDEAFTAPGRWACSARLLGGNPDVNLNSATLWARTPTVTVKGQYERDPTHTRLAPTSGHRLRLSVAPLREIAAAAVRGRLTLSLYRAGCRRHRVNGRRISMLRTRLDKHGSAVFTFRPPLSQAFYYAQLNFSGSPLMLAGADPSAILFAVTSGPSGAPRFGFGDPRTWAPCG